MEIETENVAMEKQEAKLAAYQRAFDRINESVNCLIDKLSPLAATRNPIDGDDLLAIMNEWADAFNGAIAEAVADVSEAASVRNHVKRLN